MLLLINIFDSCENMVSVNSKWYESIHLLMKASIDEFIKQSKKHLKLL